MNVGSPLKAQVLCAVDQRRDAVIEVRVSTVGRQPHDVLPHPHGDALAFARTADDNNPRDSRAASTFFNLK